MTDKNHYDVLMIKENRSSIDIIQSMIGDECLGVFFEENISKFYFVHGARKKIESTLKKIMFAKMLQWTWTIQENENWHLEWQNHFKPIVVNEKLAIIPPWEKSLPVKVNMIIKPGMAFGTGHHESTWLMLQKMLIHVKSGMRVLDLGTGTGILSIAAWKLGSREIDVVENDINCKINFIENLKLNKITDGIIFHFKNVLNWIDFGHDIVLANINRNVIEKLIPKLTKVRGKIILSGLLVSDFNEIKKLIKKNDLKILERSEKGDWLCLILTS